jgi:hypothetical protein
MRVPYVVGRWVRGPQHYGRQRLIHYLLNVPDSALWLVGTRRMGKTSLLRQLELQAEQPESTLVPLFWDLQGCNTPEALFDELQYAFEDVYFRFKPYGVTVDDLNTGDAVDVLRRVARRLAEHDRRLFLLIDEGEALISLAEEAPNWLARLRKVFQDDRQRTVLTSTKLLSRLNELTADWPTSPFLFGFSMANLWSLDPYSAQELILQAQSETPLDVPHELCAQILQATNRHPYLIQYLCQRLFLGDDSGRATLRPIQDEDLTPDHLLAGFFQIDFQHLSLVERRILLAIVRASILEERELLATLADVEPMRVRTFLYGMHKLGYLREIEGHWTVGNEFLRRWLQQNVETLAEQRESAVTSSRVEELLARGVVMEVSALNREIGQLQRDLADLERKRRLANGAVTPERLREIEFLNRALAMAQQEVAALTRLQGDPNPA